MTRSSITCYYSSNKPSIMVAVYKQDDVLKVNTDSIKNIKAKKLYIKTYLQPHKLPKRKTKVLSGKLNMFDTTTNVSMLF